MDAVSTRTPREARTRDKDDMVLVDRLGDRLQRLRERVSHYAVLIALGVGVRVGVVGSIHYQK